MTVKTGKGVGANVSDTILRACIDRGPVCAATLLLSRTRAETEAEHITPF